MRLQSRLKAVSKSVRIPHDLQSILGRQIVRFTLNPVIYRRSQDIVRWTRRGTGIISAQSVILRAVQCYPRLSLSNAVEAVLLDLLLDAKRDGPNFLSQDERTELSRFRNLSLGEKIRITQKRNRLSRYLRGLPWRQPK